MLSSSLSLSSGESTEGNLLLVVLLRPGVDDMDIARKCGDMPDAASAEDIPLWTSVAARASLSAFAEAVLSRDMVRIVLNAVAVSSGVLT
jgi:hypothetical protein